MSKKKQITDEELATIIEKQLALLSQLVPYKERIKKVMKEAKKKESYILSGAVIWEALGEDWESKVEKARRAYKRAKALYELLCTLDEVCEENQKT